MVEQQFAQLTTKVQIITGSRRIPRTVCESSGGKCKTEALSFFNEVEMISGNRAERLSGKNVGGGISKQQSRQPKAQAVKEKE